MDSSARWCGEVTSQARFRVEVSCGQTTRGHSYVISLHCSPQKLSHHSLPGHHGQDAKRVPGKDWQLLSPRVLLLKWCRHHRQLASLHQQHKHQPLLQTPQAVQPGSPSLPLPLPQHQPQEEVSLPPSQAAIIAVALCETTMFGCPRVCDIVTSLSLKTLICFYKAVVRYYLFAFYIAFTIRKK